LFSFTEHDTVTIIHSVPDAIDDLHHSIVLKYAFLSLSLSHPPPFLHLLNKPEIIFYHYSDPDSGIGIVYFGM